MDKAHNNFLPACLMHADQLFLLWRDLCEVHDVAGTFALGAVGFESSFNCFHFHLSNFPMLLESRLVIELELQCFVGFVHAFSYRAPSHDVAKYVVFSCQFVQVLVKNL